MDGCFDMMHYGHANALRQVRPLCVLPESLLTAGDRQHSRLLPEVTITFPSRSGLREGLGSNSMADEVKYTILCHRPPPDTRKR